VIVGQFDIVSIGTFQVETDAILIIHANTVTPRLVALKGFEAIARWDRQICEGPCPMQ